MQSKITDQLVAVRMRQQFSRGLSWAAAGLLFGAVVGCALLILQRADIVADSSAAWLIAVFAAGIAATAGLLWPVSWNATASLVDSSYGLKDRSLTAIDFAKRENTDMLQQLQIDDALSHLANVDAAKVMPYHVPKFAIPAAVVFAIMITIATFPIGDREQLALAAEANPVVLEQASVLEETMLEELKDLAQEHEDEELELLAEEIEEAIEELKKPETDQREALAKLSEMQQAVAEAMEQLDVEQIDAQLEQLAKALEAADATEAASQALKSQNYDQAAKELEKIDASTMDRKQLEAVKENLAKLSKKLGEGKKGELSDAVAEMSEGLENDNPSQCKDGMCKAAGVCKKQGVKKKISQCLNCQLNRLSECKSCCQGSCDKPGSKVAKSKSPSSKWGTGASNSPTGEDKTKLDSKRREESLTGMAGDGPSERETMSTPEAMQEAARAYQNKYAEFKKQMEEVLDSEPLPLGHRQTVRSYFENIRPENGDAFDLE